MARHSPKTHLRQIIRLLQPVAAAFQVFPELDHVAVGGAGEDPFLPPLLDPRLGDELGVPVGKADIQACGILNVGPHRIRQAARWLGVMTVKLQMISRSFMRQLNSELDSLDSGGDLRGAMEEVQNLRRQVEDLLRELTTSTMRPIDEGKQMLAETRQVINQTIAPPGLIPNSDSNNEQSKQIESDVSGEAESTPPASLPNIVDVPGDSE